MGKRGASEACEGLFLGQSELAGLMRRFKWQDTSIGSPDRWPESLKTAIRIILTSRQPFWIGWGEDLIYFYNDPYKSIIGGKHPAALGQPTSVVWHEIWDDIGSLLASALGGKEGTYVEEQRLIMERNGYPEETYYTFSYSPILSPDGTAGGIICANTDDTRRVISERQLALLRELAAGTAEGRNRQQVCERAAQALATNPYDLPFAMIYATESDDGALTLVSAAGIDPTQPAAPVTLPLSEDAVWPVAAALSRRELQFISDLSKVSPEPLPAGAWAQPPLQAVVLPLPTGAETGDAVVLIAGLNPFRLFDAEYSGFLDLVAGQIATSITNAEAYEAERRRAEALAEIDRAKTAFFSNASHEFRTPLTLMLSPLEELLSRGRGQPEVPVSYDEIELIHRNGLRLLRLVNTLLDFSRIEAGRLQATYAPIDVAAYTAELASTFRSAVERAGLRFVVDCRPLSVPVFLDRGMWENIVLNLLSNAFKFTLDGEVAVSIAPDDTGNWVTLKVRDTGVGIPEHELPRLFERFHRIEGQVGRSQEGTGIGLALVYELVKLHGGKIDVTSRPGGGTIFKISIPTGTAHLPRERIRPDSAARLVAGHAAAFVEEALRWLPDVDVPASGIEKEIVASDLPESGSDERSLVLLADDNADMRDYIRRLLEPLYEVETAGDGEAAWAAARKQRPDLVLSDVMMPRLDGFGLLHRIRADADLAEVPVVLLSARAGEEAQVEGLQAGADDYLTKPFSARELLVRVSSNLSLARVRQRARALLREETHRLEVLNRTATTLAAELELEPLAQAVTDAATELTGAKFGAFFYNVSNDGGESYLLYTLSGASRADFEDFPQPRNTPLLAPTFSGAGIVRLGDIRKDPRYGDNTPNKGPPKDHLPIVSYLAVPVVAPAGDVIGGLFFAHPEPDRFTDQHELIVAGIAGQAAVAFEKARLYRQTRDAEASLRQLNATLEQRIEERTREVKDVFAQLHESERQFRHLVESVADYAIFLLNLEGIVTSWNAGAERIKGYVADEIIGHHFSTFYTEEDRDSGLPALALSTARRTGRFEMEGWRVRKGGERFWASVTINAVHDEHGHLIGFAKVTRDLTERRAMEDQVRQIQKMEAIGQLTGGIAHDFNNMLQIIGGNIETLQRRIGHEDPNALRLITAALYGAERASTLTHRLLAYSRRQPLDPKPTDLNRLVIGMSDLLTRTLGERIKVESVLSGGLWHVLADPNQIENAVLNLVVNARDAMPDGGNLTIETANTQLDEAYADAHADVTAGHYVMLAVSDGGIGMTADVVEKAFEPFFTTKKLGDGTGLGLSQVYGFVKQSGGHIKIYSEPGEGTTVRIYFPRAPLPTGTREPRRAQPQIPELGGSETILVVEDDADVRAYTTEILRELGYRVLEAYEGDAALGFLASEPEIELLFTDIGLPGPFNGRQLSDEARKIHPDIKVLLTTGYAQNAIIHQGRLDPSLQLIVKPFSFAGLAAKIRQILDSGPGKTRG